MHENNDYRGNAFHHKSLVSHNEVVNSLWLNIVRGVEVMQI
jgi:hypothetical protein